MKKVATAIFSYFIPKKLENTVKTALKQITKKQYETVLIAKGVPKEKTADMTLHFTEKSY